MPGDYKNFRQIQKRVAGVGLIKVRAGIFGDAEAAKRGRWAEYGTRYAPERPWMRATFVGKRAEIRIYMAMLTRRLIKGTITAEGFGDRLGRKLKALLRETIEKDGPLIFAPLAPSTIRRKGHDHPLLHTHRMFDAIGYRVTRGR